MLFIFLISGLIIGSFLNVVVYRLHTAEEFFFSRSKCPHCSKLIRWYDNIPVFSFIVLRARCRDCDKKISWQYPLVEVLTALIFTAIGWKFFDPLQVEMWLPTAYYLFISASLIVILAYDWLHYEIPSAVLWVAIFLAVAFNLWTDASAIFFDGASGSQSFSSNLAAIAAFSFFFVLSAGSREKWMGMGDAYLAILIGLFLGWPQILLALFLSFFFGSFYGIIMVMSGRKKMKSQVPFAPFMISGAFIALLFYPAISDWYFSLSSIF